MTGLPEGVAADATWAMVLVALIAVREHVGGELRESVGYLLASAQQRHGGPADGVETGMIGGDLAGLVERIAGRVR